MRVFKQWLKEIDVALTHDQIKQFETYYDTLVEWNEKMNLTRITDKEDAYEKHFFDSLLAANCYDFTSVQRMIDVGGGAGFPSIPLKIAYPHLDVTILDASNKRIQFLTHVAKVLELDNVHPIHSRAEDAARDDNHRDQYDVAIARAVAIMPVLAEYCLPFVKPQGVWIAMKGKGGEEEREEAEVAIKRLQGTVSDNHYFELPTEASERRIYVVGKRDATPDTYPRKAGTITKKPLM
ncbi:rRNA small subunit methyltransferase [Geomicrobium sp. JCM 19037]|uniref:16S rRNA (guanine(527)-N(7))-methyltransferase RsmG n=1 Tax=Geomicrobium sp. JCM 19037 TaxID=1460634 RepID=UPI00045F1070|nr:16S rRNA (guanine(527)-N(7))-methyltransferase RsmG [Geomicrobium sp. JCM 19037]GAK04822.1 rRNA small subunit methyltransferase [Geomicrobium sp. JCM 19037]